MVDLTDRQPLCTGDTRAQLTGGDVAITQQPRTSFLLLCGPDDVVSGAAFRAAVLKATALALPQDPRTAAAAQGRAALWLSPGRWLIRMESEELAAVTASLDAVAADFDSFLADLSHQYTVFSVAGSRARSLLARGCSLDLRPENFSKGHYAQTLLGELPLLIQQTDDTPGYDLIVDQSLATFAWWWLADQVTCCPVPGEEA